MATTFAIPLIASPQTLSVALAGATYQFTILWNGQSQSWTLDIADDSGNDVVTGIPMVPGATLLAQYGYLQLGFDLFVQNDTDVDAVPGFLDLGTVSHLYVVMP